jgi:hypothetical protein
MSSAAALTAPLGDVSYELAGLDGCTCSRPCGHSYRKRHERAQRGTAVASSDLAHCPRGNIWNPSCKRRDCKFCGPRWSRNWELIFQLATDHYNRSVVMVAVTPPGEERLPWDEEWCSHRKPHQHKGPSGCRVQERAAREWSDTAGERYKLIRDAAAKFTRRHGPQPVTLIGRVWEPQRRGVPHLHIVLGYGVLVERISANLFVAYLKANASEYDFGWVEQPWDAKRCNRDHVDENGRHVHDPAHGCRVKLSGITGAEAARYLVRYLTGRSKKKKATIRENVSHPNMPTSLIWITPRLTSLKRGGTGVTMRTLRRSRHLWAVAKGRCEQWPRWKGVREAVIVGWVCARVFARKGESGEPPPLEPLLRMADDMQSRFDALPAGYDVVEQREKLIAFSNMIALKLSGLTPDPAMPAFAEAA